MIWTCLASDSYAATPAEVSTALERAKKWLYAQQKEGHWEPVDPSEKIKDHPHFQITGRTALAVLALLHSGESSQEPRLKPAIDYLLKTPADGVYALGLRSQVWLALPKTPQVLQQMRADARLLLANVKTDGNAKGMYDYTPVSAKKYSHSRSQYGVLGVWAAAQMGVEVPDAYWQMVDDGWRRNQDKGGGWGYMHMDDNKQPPTPGMTAVGVASLFVTQEYLRSQNNLACKGNASNPAIERGIKWLADNMNLYASDATFHREFPYVTMYAYERVGAASGLRYIGGVDWFEKGADWLVKTQHPVGLWGGVRGEGAISAPSNTCFAMLFLAKGRAPIVMSKLQYTTADGKEAAWNQRSRDVANATRSIGRLIERELAFQIVDLKAPLEDLIEAPILYLAGSEPVSFSAAHKQKLKAYVEAGGMIVANADCGSTAFSTSIRNLGKELFPDYELAALPEDHLLYTSYYPRSKWRSKPRVEAISNGVRQLLILIPQADAGKAWQMQDDKSKAELFELGANLVLYAVDRQNLRFRGERFYVPDDPKLATKYDVTVARLKYAGNWDPEPGGWRRFNNVMRQSQATAVSIRTVELGKGDLAGIKIAHLTGTDDMKLAEQQREALRKFVEQGGTLVIDAAGGSSRFAASAEQELAQLFPADKPVVIADDHAICDALAYGTPMFRAFARKVVGRNNKPLLQGITIKGRLAVIYSREDLSAGLVGQAVDGIVGYEPVAASVLMAGIVNHVAQIAPPAPATQPTTAPATQPAKLSRKAARAAAATKPAAAPK